MKNKKSYKKKLSKLAVDVVDDIDSILKKVGKSITEIITEASKDKIQPLWEKEKVILKSKIKKKLNKETKQKV